MTKRAQRKLKMQMKRVFRQAVQARKKQERMLRSFRKLQRKYRAA